MRKNTKTKAAKAAKAAVSVQPRTVKRRADFKTKTVSYRLPAEIQKAVNLESARREVGKSALVELAIRRLLKIPVVPQQSAAA